MVLSCCNWCSAWGLQLVPLVVEGSAADGAMACSMKTLARCSVGIVPGVEVSVMSQVRDGGWGRLSCFSVSAGLLCLPFFVDFILLRPPSARESESPEPKAFVQHLRSKGMSLNEADRFVQKPRGI